MPNSSKKAENAIEATAKTPAAENSVPAAVETTTAAEALTETEKASKPDAPKKRGRKPAASKTAAPAAKKEKNTVSKSKKPAAAEKENIPEVKTEAPKDETPKKRGRKPAASKAGVPEANTEAPVEKAPKKRGKKAAAAKTDIPEVKAKTAMDETPKKRGRKPAAAKSKAPAGKGGRKKSVTRDAIIDAAKKRMKTADISKIKYPIALNLEINNFDGEDNKYVYILISDGNIEVKPYRYNDYDFSFRGDAENILNVMNGKTNIYDAFANGLIKIDGNNIKKAILFINAAF